jgi:hypothetical protein
MHKIADKCNNTKYNNVVANVKCHNNSNVRKGNKLTDLKRMHHVIICPIFYKEIYEKSLLLIVNL